MSAVPQQVFDFLKTSAPFDLLSVEELKGIAQHAQLIYLTEENKQVLVKEHNESLFLIQSGQFSVKDSDGPLRHLSDGDYFGIIGLLDNVEYDIDVNVDSPGLVFCLQRSDVKQAMENVEFGNFFNSAKTDALQNQAVTDSNSMWLYKPLAEVIAKAPVQADEQISIFEAAQLMSKHNVSSLLVTDGGELTGIVTDRDMRNRVVAQNTPYSASVA